MSVVTIIQGTACKTLKANAAQFNTPSNSMRSMETVYSVPSSRVSVLTRRKTNQRNRDRNHTLVPAVSEIKQRVASARMLRIKQLQNQISETQHRLSDLMTENRTLKALQRRHESALSRHEGPSAELPQLLNSHAEELRMWTTRCRNLQQRNLDLQAKLKLKEQIIITVTDQNKTLHQLDRNKNLLERAALQERVKVLEERATDKEKEIKLLMRRLQLAEKAYKTNLHMEQQKYRELLTKIEMSDFLLSADGNIKKASPRTSLNRGGMVHNKSPSNRIGSKSAVSQSNGGSLITEATATTTLLPPCADSKIEEGIKLNSPCVVNSNVKLMPDIKSDDFEEAINEVDLTKNCVDKSKVSQDEKDAVVDEKAMMIRVNDGMSHRARQQANKPAAKAPKLSPLHTAHQQPSVKKGGKKTTSDESEFSDEDFHFYSDHNGTKMAQLLEHKMHVAELESKMKQNSLDSTGSRKNSYQHDNLSNSSFSSHDAAVKSEDAISHNHNHFHQFNKDRGDSGDLASIQRQIRDSIMHRESMLDEFCDRLVDKDSFYSGNATVTRAKYTHLAATENGGSRLEPQQSYQIINYHKTNGYAANGGAGGGGGVRVEKERLEENKKTKLLAALKHIDNISSSIEK